MEQSDRMTESDNDRIFRKAKELGMSPQDESYIEFEARVLKAIREKR